METCRCPSWSAPIRAVIPSASMIVVKTDVAWHWVRTSGGLMKAHEDDMPSMTLGGLSQYSEPTIVRTNAERQRTRAWYVGERVRAMDEGRAWQMTAVGGHAVQPRDGYEPRPRSVERYGSSPTRTRVRPGPVATAY